MGILRFLLALAVYASSSYSFAQESCSYTFRENFSWLNTYQLSPSVRTFLNQGRVSHRELDELFANRISHPLPERHPGFEGHFWFLSETQGGYRYKVTVTRIGNQALVTFVMRSTLAMESYYYKVHGQSVPERVVDLEHPFLGRNQLHISGSVQTKLYEKHQLTVHDVVIALDNYTGELNRNTNPRWADRDSYFVRTRIPGHDKPLNIVLLVDENQDLVLVTAFLVNTLTRRR